MEVLSQREIDSLLNSEDFNPDSFYSQYKDNQQTLIIDGMIIPYSNLKLHIEKDISIELQIPITKFQLTQDEITVQCNRDTKNHNK